jgi:FixJ family two-component response regulator
MTTVVAVVDDDLRVLESLENLLESAGHTVRLFRSATALLAKCAFDEIDCLISDVSMPGIDGSELEGLAHAARPELPVILITGHDVTARARAAIERSQGFFRKPFDGRQLLAAVSKALPASRRDH